MSRPPKDLAPKRPGKTVSRASIQERRPEPWLALAQLQLLGAELALAAVDAARWDGYQFVLPRRGAVLELVAVPAEFTRDLGLGRLRAAIEDRVNYWRKIVNGGRGRCLWCGAVLPTALMLDHACRWHVIE